MIFNRALFCFYPPLKFENQSYTVLKHPHTKSANNFVICCGLFRINIKVCEITSMLSTSTSLSFALNIYSSSCLKHFPYNDSQSENMWENAPGVMLYVSCFPLSENEHFCRTELICHFSQFSWHVLYFWLFLGNNKARSPCWAAGVSALRHCGWFHLKFQLGSWEGMEEKLVFAHRVFLTDKYKWPTPRRSILTIQPVCLPNANNENSFMQLLIVFLN